MAKKFFSILIAAIMVMALVPMTAFAEYRDVTVENIDMVVEAPVEGVTVGSFIAGFALPEEAPYHFVEDEYIGYGGTVNYLMYTDDPTYSYTPDANHVMEVGETYVIFAFVRTNDDGAVFASNASFTLNGEAEGVITESDYFYTCTVDPTGFDAGLAYYAVELAVASAPVIPDPVIPDSVEWVAVDSLPADGVAFAMGVISGSDAYLIPNDVDPERYVPAVIAGMEDGKAIDLPENTVWHTDSTMPNYIFAGETDNSLALCARGWFFGVSGTEEADSFYEWTFGANSYMYSNSTYNLHMGFSPRSGSWTFVADNAVTACQIVFFVRADDLHSSAPCFSQTRMIWRDRLENDGKCDVRYLFHMNFNNGYFYVGDEIVGNHEDGAVAIQAIGAKIEIGGNANTVFANTLWDVNEADGWFEYTILIKGFPNANYAIDVTPVLYVHYAPIYGMTVSAAPSAAEGYANAN